MANTLSFMTLGVCAASIVCALLALALPYWQTYELYHQSYNTGLFLTCFGSCVNTIDKAHYRYKTHTQITLALVLMGAAALVGSLIFFVLLVLVMKKRKIMGFIAGILAMAGGSCLLGGMLVYALKLKVHSFSYGVAVVFDLIGWLTGWIAGVLMLFITFTGGV